MLAYMMALSNDETSCTSYVLSSATSPAGLCKPEWRFGLRQNFWETELLIFVST